jgi:hypothetical protein
MMDVEYGSKQFSQSPKGMALAQTLGNLGTFEEKAFSFWPLAVGG